jgi:hypothetical protein
MTDQVNAVIPCPKCKSPETVRTGAYNIDARDDDAQNAERVVTVVYDRRCECGHRFTETVEAERG